MMNLFSVFDPISYWDLPLNWVILFMVFMLYPMKFYLLKGNCQNIVVKFMMEVSKMFSEVAGVNKLGMVFIVVCSFIYLVMTNLIGLFPYTFSGTAHPLITLGMGLVMWLSFFFMGWVKNFKISAAHLVPEGSPIFLAPLMVVIETISHLMRPFTLSIRLAANMMAGHLIISLLASISTLSFLGFFSSFFFQSILLVLELGVSVIQGFVFSILLLLYALEYY